MSNDRDGVERSSDLNWKVIGGIVVLALAVIFILQNTETQNINFLFWDVEVGMWFGLLIALLLGVLIGWLAPKFLRRRNND